MNWKRTACIALALGVILGAFGAHGLKGSVTDYSLSIWEKAVFYHITQALGLLLIAENSSFSGKCHTWSQILLSIGILLFSGSLYVLVLTDVRWMGAITPFGGTALIAGWVCAAVAASGRRSSASE